MLVLSEFIEVSEVLLGELSEERTPLRDLDPASMHQPQCCPLRRQLKCQSRACCPLW